MMKLDDLEQGAWYFGHGRLGPVAQWDGKLFVGIGFSWGQHEINHMDYGDRGFSPYAVIDRSFTPEVLQMVNDAIDGSMGLKPPPKAPEITSLQDLSVIQRFLIEFMEVGTYLMNVETQKELLKVAMGKIACSRADDANELRQQAREALVAMHSLRRQ